MRRAAFVGFDAAGKALLPGGTWEILKQIAQPVIEEFQRRYPQSFLLNGSTNPDLNQVDAAIKALSSDKALTANADIRFCRPE